ncbi:MAG TPA: RNA methyltransferase [Rhodocyclaceae bacterium]
MNAARLSSADNPLIKRTRRLVSHARDRREAALVVLDGAHLLAAWSAAGRDLEYVLLGDKGADDAEIVDLLASFPRATIHRVSDRLLASVSPVETPTGVVAVAKQPFPAQAPDERADSVLLDGVQDPGNLGGILRTAAATGWRQVLLSPDCTQAWSPKALRAGMGAQLALQIHEGVDLVAFLGGYQGLSLAADVGAQESLFALSHAPDLPLAWAFGAEGRGLRPAVLAAVGKRVGIPMSAATESLNVGAAAALCLYEGWRRRSR